MSISRESAMVEGRLSKLRSETAEFKRAAQRVFALHCSSGFFL